MLGAAFGDVVKSAAADLLRKRTVNREMNVV
jgi:hypothetical protein